MTEDVETYTSNGAMQSNGVQRDIPAEPRPTRSRGLLPITWLNREVHVEYVDADGAGARTSGRLLDWFPFGPAFSLAGARTILNWDRVILIELAGD